MKLTLHNDAVKENFKADMSLHLYEFRVVGIELMF